VEHKSGWWSNKHDSGTYLNPTQLGIRVLADPHGHSVKGEGSNLLQAQQGHVFHPAAPASVRQKVVHLDRTSTNS
jgi:hypothetical protein